MQRVYIDTTVPSAYFDGRTPDRQSQTQEFWKRLPSYEATISALVLGEIRDTPDPDRRKNLENLVGDLPVLSVTAEAEILAEEYVKRGAIPSKYRDDALHVAIAVVHQVQLLASWNFHHLVNVKARRLINLVNALLGHGQIEIVSPPEL
jgi:predicted nucleic acid-binding protein